MSDKADHSEVTPASVITNNANIREQKYESGNGGEQREDGNKKTKKITAEDSVQYLHNVDDVEKAAEAA